jgi:deazaflavin-dependent oxidoreductase (nitroreductase family)
MTDMNDWNRNIIEQFRSNAGQVGGQFEGMPMLLLHTTGAKSGAARINPLAYLEFEGRMFVWYYNLVAHPDVKVEVGTETHDVKAVVLSGEEHDRVYAEQSSRIGTFAEYQEKTSRVIPVVELVPAN